MTGRTLPDGIYAMLVTPMYDDGTINTDALLKEIDWCVAKGAIGVVVTPSIGEFACLDDTERHMCMDVCAKHIAKNHPHIIPIATVADTCTHKVRRHVQVALNLGYKAAQLIPPYYWHPVVETEVYEFYKSVAEMELPIVVYHNPLLSKVSMSPKFLGKLAQLPGVVAIKETKTDRQVHLEPLFDAVGESAKIFTTFRVFSTGLILGSTGGFINVFALEPCVAMWKMWGAEIAEEFDMRSGLEKLQNLTNIVFPRGGEDNPYHIGTIKMAASVVTGIAMGPPRAPYMLPDNKFKTKLHYTLPGLRKVISVLS